MMCLSGNLVIYVLNTHALKLFLTEKFSESLTGIEPDSIPVRDSESFSERTAWERAY